MAEGTSDANLAITCITWLECFLLMFVEDQPESCKHNPVAEGTEGANLAITNQHGLIVSC